jgi:hypothetical protein
MRHVAYRHCLPCPLITITITITITNTNEEGKEMRERFNVTLWEKRMRQAIADRNGDYLAQLMYENDRNGCFSYDQVCFEFGEMSREEWLDGNIECAESMLSEINEE